MLNSIYGESTELDLELKMQNPRIVFGPQSGEHAKFSCDFYYGLKKLDSLNYIIYDRMHFESTFDVEISQEVLFSNIQTMRVTKGGKDVERTQPIFKDFEMTEEEYA